MLKLTRILDLTILLGGVGCPLQGCPRNGGNEQCCQQAEWWVQINTCGGDSIHGGLIENSACRQMQPQMHLDGSRIQKQGGEENDEAWCEAQQCAPPHHMLEADIVLESADEQSAWKARH